MPKPWPITPSCSESRGNWGQNGASAQNAATALTASSADKEGRLPMPVTAPARAAGMEFPDCFGRDVSTAEMERELILPLVTPARNSDSGRANALLPRLSCPCAGDN